MHIFGSRQATCRVLVIIYEQISSICAGLAAAHHHCEVLNQAPTLPCASAAKLFSIRTHLFIESKSTSGKEASPCPHPLKNIIK